MTDRQIVLKYCPDADLSRMTSDDIKQVADVYRKQAAQAAANSVKLS